MKQLFIEPSDTIQVIIQQGGEHHAQQTTSSSIVAEWFSNLIDSCSEGIWHIPCLNSLNIFVAILLIVVFISIWKPQIKLFLFRHLKIQAFFIWLFGVVIYMAGFNEHGSAESNIALILRSCLSSMEMFVSHSDLIEVRKELHSKATYMALFSLIHFCAVAISAIFILRLFGFKIVSWIKVMWSCLWSWVHFDRCYYVMFGVNANTLALAKSMPNDKRHHRVIFINMPDKGHNHASTRFSFSHFFHSNSNGIDKYIEDIEEMGALMFNSSRSFDNSNSCCCNSDVFKVFRTLGFSWIVRAPLQKLLRNTAKRKTVEFFFLSEDEQDNLIAISTLQRLQKEPLDEDCFFNCYCHARKNRNNLAMLNDGTLAFRVHIIDTSNLAVLELKKNTDYHPVNFVDKGGKPGTVASAFTGMVIGFGETGRDAFRFLYEFSSFTKDDEGNPSVKKIHIIDKDIDGLKADFLNNAPALRNKSEIDWWKAKSTHTEEFWKRMKDVIQSLNYVVVTVGDSDEAVSIATSILEYAYRYRDNLDRFKIFVRLRKSIQENFLRTHKEFFDIIIPFGSDKAAFSYEIINNDVLEKKAKLFYYRYDMLVNNKTISGDENEEIGADKMWIKRRRAYQDESDAIKRKENEIKVWYQEEQDRSNAWHIYTKVALAKDMLLNSNEQLLESLSNCEHLRWNAKMELLGFEPATEEDIQKVKADHENGKEIHRPWKSFRHRRHEAMVDCKTLRSNPDLKISIPYDESIVKLSFEINKEEMNKVQQNR